MSWYDMHRILSSSGLAELPPPVAWRPVFVKERGAAKHETLTRRIVEAIASGALRPMDRMPPHRDLARALGVSVQTVSLAYREAERLGYLRGEQGRGTFVRMRVTDRAGRFMLDRNVDETADLSIIRAVYSEAHEQASRAAMAELARSDNSAFMRPCRPIAGQDAHREAALRWLRPLGVRVPAERVIITNGAAHAVFLALAAIVRPGDVVATENLTEHGVIGLGHVLGFTLKGLATDAQGLIPEALEELCRIAPPRALAMTPTLSNPTGNTAGAARRRAIAEIARRHRIFVVEDEVFKPLIAEPLPAYVDLLPELGFLATSFTKTVMTGLRAGYLATPAHYATRVASILRVTGWSATSLPAEIATRWVLDGTAHRLVEIQREETQARQAILKRELGDHIASTHPFALCAWLRVPPGWSEDALVRELASRRVAVSASELFVAGPGHGGGMRVCLGGRLSRAAFGEALATVRAVFDQAPPVMATRPIE